MTASGGKRAYVCRLGKDGVRAIADKQLRAWSMVHRPKRKFEYLQIMIERKFAAAEEDHFVGVTWRC